MHPWDHARSSARLHGGMPEAYLSYHCWFDATKVALPHFRHRVLRHHREGLEVACRIFGHRLNVPGNSVVDTETLGLQHLNEDLACTPFARDWLQCAEGDSLPVSWPNAEALAARSRVRFGGAIENFRPLHEWFLETRHWMPDRRHLILRHHAFGIFEAETRFGIVLRLSNGTSVPTRIVAERHVREVMGSIPTTSAMLQLIRPQKWMATSPAKLRLDEGM
jgi:hypothetical protein